MSDPQRVIASFISLNPGEEPGREYQVLIANHRRWSVLRVLIILVLGVATYGIGGLIALLYFSLRRLKTIEGYAMVTNHRVLYYEYCRHRALNFHHTRQANVGDIAGVRLYLEQGLFARRFTLALWSQASSALHIAGGRNWLTRFFSQGTEPGLNTTEFVQDVSSIILRHRLAAGGTGGSAVQHG